MEGVRFGLLMAPLLVAPSFVQYAVTTVPLSLVGAWVFFEFVQKALAGVVAGLVYRR
jgi:hypothetical protein